jgi:hypothetical protein
VSDSGLVFAHVVDAAHMGTSMNGSEEEALNYLLRMARNDQLSEQESV